MACVCGFLVEKNCCNIFSLGQTHINIAAEMRVARALFWEVNECPVAFGRVDSKTTHCSEPPFDLFASDKGFCQNISCVGWNERLSHKICKIRRRGAQTNSLLVFVLINMNHYNSAEVLHKKKFIVISFKGPSL